MPLEVPLRDYTKSAISRDAAHVGRGDTLKHKILKNYWNYNTGSAQRLGCECRRIIRELYYHTF
jgi:hypothetical protein